MMTTDLTTDNNIISYLFHYNHDFFLNKESKMTQKMFVAGASGMIDWAGVM
ncbi:hypothetical protein [Rodentibacter genomosp. 2]|uniref:hypothetical protein n=1 Tax=Rodentibacter genomosp. 2 TaxID=1908266 RepID=UPI0015C2D511|nr:hypothetical protein [Rodentibacter genomosp. 2]